MPAKAPEQDASQAAHQNKASSSRVLDLHGLESATRAPDILESKRFVNIHRAKCQFDANVLVSESKGNCFTVGSRPRHLTLASAYRLALIKELAEYKQETEK